MTRWATPAVFALALLSACGGVAGTTREQEISLQLRSLTEADQRREVGTVEGYLYLREPGVPMPLKDWPVTLIPLPPTVEGAVTRAKAQFAAPGRVPLSARALAVAHRPITEYLTSLRAGGHETLIRRVKTETGENPKFTFQDVPQGRWLLLAELPSTVSVLLWAQPVTVTSGEVTWQSLNDQNIWLEGLTR
jgi:hypothetical protein